MFCLAFLACASGAAHPRKRALHPPKRALNRALLKAVAFGDADRVRRLLSRGADPNAHDEGGQTALMAAAFEQDEGAAYCYNDIAAILVQHGASVNARDMNGQTPLGYLAQVGFDNESDAVSLAKYLLAHGARASLKDRETAHENGMERLARLLKRAANAR